MGRAHDGLLVNQSSTDEQQDRDTNSQDLQRRRPMHHRWEATHGYYGVKGCHGEVKQIREIGRSHAIYNFWIIWIDIWVSMCLRIDIGLASANTLANYLLDHVMAGRFTMATKDYPNLELQSDGRCWLWHFGRIRLHRQSTMFFFCHHRVNKKEADYVLSKILKEFRVSRSQKGLPPKVDCSTSGGVQTLICWQTSNTPAKFYTIIPLLWL